jgi:hypothetical protein
LTPDIGKPVPGAVDLDAACAHLMREFIPILRAHPEHCERELIRRFRLPLLERPGIDSLNNDEALIGDALPVIINR